MTENESRELASVEATRAALHMRSAREDSREALGEIDRAIDGVRELLRSSESHGE